MSLFEYLQLQPIEPQDDGTVSDLDQYNEDEVIDLTEETDGELLMREWEEISQSIHDMHEANREQ